jgi:hypothetical protein
MAGNRHIAKLIKNYIRYAHPDRARRTFSSYTVTTSTLEEVDTELSRLASLVFLERYKKLRIDLSKVPEEQIKNDIMFVLANVFGLCGSVMSQQECEELADRAAKTAKTGNTNYSNMQKSFSDINLYSDTLNRIWKILGPALLYLQPLFAKKFGNKDLDKMLQYVINNRDNIVSVEVKVGKRAETEEDIIDHIEGTVGKTLLVVYERFEEGLAGPPSANLTPREVAMISYKSSKRVYNYLLKHQYVEIKTMPDDVKKSNLFTEDMKNLLITAVSHHILANIHQKLELSTKQVIDAINQGSFEVMFVDAEGKKSYVFTEDMYITLQNVGGEDIIFHLKLISISFAERTRQDGSADVDNRTGFTNFYVKLPVGLAPFEMSGMNEPVFKLQVQIKPLEGQMNNNAQVSLNQGTSNRYLKNKRLFSKRKKYDWM